MTTQGFPLSGHVTLSGIVCYSHQKRHKRIVDERVYYLSVEEHFRSWSPLMEVFGV
jgi:hypothetical protein